LITGFIEHLHTQLVTRTKCTAIANSHTLQFTTAHTKSSQSAVFTGSLLATASNAIGSSTSVFMSLLAGDFLTNDSKAGGHHTPLSCSSHCTQGSPLSESQSYVNDRRSVGQSLLMSSSHSSVIKLKVTLLLTVSQSVSQSVLVSSPIWGL
jgi:hypothetical protein